MFGQTGKEKNISILTLYRMKMQGYYDIYKWTILKRTSPDVKCLHPTSSRRGCARRALVA